MPPKIARRKRQHRDLESSVQAASRKGEDGGGEGDEIDDEEDEEVDIGTTTRTSKSSSSSNNVNSSIAAPPEDDRVWVQCNTCDKWRALPSTVDPNSLPDIWFCQLNTFDNDRNLCEYPEESYSEGTDEPLKSFLKLWTKKLKTADKAETRMSSSAVTRGRKRRTDVEWIRCCIPSCGKWRAVVRSIDTQQMLARLCKGGKWGSKGLKWYCSMNSWDETQASCASPQEQLYDCRWNVGGSNSSMKS